MKRAIKILSMLLAVLLVVGLLPVGASAAYDPGGNPYVEFKLKAGQPLDVFAAADKADFNVDYFINGVNGDWEAIEGVAPDLGYNASVMGNNETGLQRNADVLNGIFVENGEDAPDGVDIVVNQGDSFLVALDIDMSHALQANGGISDFNGIKMGMNVHFFYDNDAFKLDTSRSIMNPILDGKVITAGMPATAYRERFYSAGYTLTTVDKAGTGAAEKQYLLFQFRGSPTYFMATETKWEAFAYFTVDANAEPGNYTFSYVANEGANINSNIDYTSATNGSASIGDTKLLDASQNLKANDLVVRVLNKSDKQNGTYDNTEIAKNSIDLILEQINSLLMMPFNSLD